MGKSRKVTLKKHSTRGSGDKDLGYEVVALENTVTPTVHSIIPTYEVKALIRTRDMTVIIK